jgi:23S rRNA (cytosine1962-C5)-methyltransferase
MSLLRNPNQKPVKLQLRRDLVRSVKRGHAWIYADALRATPQSDQGVAAILLDNKGGREIGRGYYDPQGVIAMRVCTTHRGSALDDSWAIRRVRRAISLRKGLFDGSETTAYRLFNGEGDGLPGMVCDRYADAAVLQFDGEPPRRFWDVSGIAQWLADELGLNLVFERYRDQGTPGGRSLYGLESPAPVAFLEHGMRFTADLVHGQKTGFYLDQRQNRKRVQKFVRGKRVLNVFGYTGGFSVYAGVGGAAHVTTVDTAQPALKAAKEHWGMNDLPDSGHTTECADAFEFLRTAREEGQVWDTVILDPPSFAPSKQAVPKALKAYQRMVAGGAAVTVEDGILAVSSCSSHVSQGDFLHACQEGIGQARRKATTLGIYSQPPDHPVPLAMPEFRYLKFVIMRVQG